MSHCRSTRVRRDPFSAPVACKSACTLSGWSSSLPIVSQIVEWGER
jgi:hypothetical protein